MKKILGLVLLVMTWINAEITVVSDSNYEKKIKTNKKVVLLFSAPWCGACKEMHPSYEKFATQNKKSALFAEVNTDDNQNVSARYKIESLPTLVLLENGKEVKRVSGSLDMEELGFLVYTQKSVKKYLKACDGGDAQSCLSLGEVYEEGAFLQKDYTKALKLYEKSCTLNNAEGCMYLGYMYDEALGVNKDYKKAIEYYTKACDGGNVIACRFLGYIYDEGLGGFQDYKKAEALYLKACNSEDEYACNNLGYMYEKGNGTAKNLVKAIEFYTRSCAFGHDAACDEVERLKQ